MSDDFVKSRLAQSKMWINVRQVVLVYGYLPNACYFEQNHCSRALLLGISSRNFVRQMSESDTVCAVQLDSSGVRRWEVAFEVACEAQARTVSDSKPVTFDEVIMSRFSAKDKALDEETATGGFNVKWALKCWESDAANEFVADKISNWPNKIAHSSATKRWMSRAAVALATGLYGCLHAAAWNADYPSNFERTIWRVSSLIVAFSGAPATPFFMLLVMLQRKTGAVELAKDDEADEEEEVQVKLAYHLLTGSYYAYSTTESVGLCRLIYVHFPSLFCLLTPPTAESSLPGGLLRPRNDSRTPKLVYQPSRWGFIADWFDFVGGYLMMFLGAVGVSYVAARVFIVGEAFASLRMLPVKAYETPDWTNLLLHW